MEERLAAIERVHRADVMDKARKGTRRTLAGRVGGFLVRLGTWLQQPGKAVEQVGGK